VNDNESLAAGVEASSLNPPVVVEYQPGWPIQAAILCEDLRRLLGPSVERIEHIGSTAIPAMAAKDVLDIQISVTDLEQAAEVFDRPLGLLGFRRLPHDRDHLPAGSFDDPAQWVKRFWVRRD
jgi:GrpB-like predicted nucleotidyltransferase (UPF0157 family)